MAKGLRASSKKANRSLLRQNVFGPVEAARKERLSAKLLELASTSLHAIPAVVKMAEEGHEEEEIVAQNKSAENNDVAKTSADMDLDEDESHTAIVSKRKQSSSLSKKSLSGRVHKRGGRGKASAAMTFSVSKQRKGAGGAGRKRMPRI